ncbi:MAG: hypothetical protein PHX70_08585 [Clostridium sp.]|nr:hypothetical protein [Clostridium sp.]
MAKYRYVYTNFWEDPKILEEFTPEDKFFYLYLLTNSCTTQIGVYRITPKFMSFEIGYTIESINSLISRFEEHHKLIRYNKNTHELALKEWGKINLNKGGRPIEDCIKSEFSKVEDKSLLAYVMDSIKNVSIKQLFINELEKDTTKEKNKASNDDTYNDTLYDTPTIREEEKTKNTVYGKPSDNAMSDDTYHDTSTIRGQKENKKENKNKKEYIYTANDNESGIGIFKNDEMSSDKQDEEKTNVNDDIDSIAKTANYKAIVGLYNKICKSLPEVTTITESRKNTLKARCKTFKDIKKFYELFTKAEKSEFLSGRSGKWTACNFDWLIKESNMIKVLEGTYSKNAGPSYRKTQFNDYKQREYDYDVLEAKLLDASRKDNKKLADEMKNDDRYKKIMRSDK